MLKFKGYQMKERDNKITFEVEFDDIPKDLQHFAIEIAARCVHALAGPQ